MREEERVLAAAVAVTIKQSHIRALSLIVKDDFAHDFDAVEILRFAIAKVQVDVASCAVAMCSTTHYFLSCYFA